MAGQAKVYFKVDTDTTAFGIDLQINSFVYDIDKNELWNIDAAADATDTLTTIAKTQVNTGGGSGDVVGPAGATDGNVAVFDTATGKKIKDGGTLGDAAFKNEADIDHDALTNTHTIPPQSGDAADTLADAYTIPFWNTVASVWKKITANNLYLWLKDKFDLIYSTFSGSYNDLSDVPLTFPPSSHQHPDTAINLTETYTNNLAGATTQKEANDVLDAFSGGDNQAQWYIIKHLFY